MAEDGLTKPCWQCMALASLYGFIVLHEVLKEIETLIPGDCWCSFRVRMTKTFYRLLDARDGWSYSRRRLPACEQIRNYYEESRLFLRDPATPNS